MRVIVFALESRQSSQHIRITHYWEDNFFYEDQGIININRRTHFGFVEHRGNCFFRAVYNFWDLIKLFIYGERTYQVNRFLGVIEPTAFLAIGAETGSGETSSPLLISTHTLLYCINRRWRWQCLNLVRVPAVTAGWHVGDGIDSAQSWSGFSKSIILNRFGQLPGDNASING